MPPVESGLTVTDGTATWTLIETGQGRPPLAMTLGDMPPRHVGLRGVSHAIETATRGARGDVSGGVVCLTPGTTILTDRGPRAVETLGEGCRIQTKDDGCAEVLWIGARRVTGARLYAMPHLSPIRRREGALDRGLPDAGLLVSPAHRVVLRGARAQALFDTDEVLVAARDLVNDTSILIDRAVREVT